MREELVALVGRKVHIRISDPWEFGGDVGAHPSRCVVEQVSVSEVIRRNGATRTQNVVVRVERPFVSQQHTCEFFLATPRHEGSSFVSLRSGDTIAANFSRIASLAEAGDAGIPLVGSICEDGGGAV
jgi:hypothetical protein